MRLLRLKNDGGFSLVELFGKEIPRYAVLSHTWGADDGEVTFKDLEDGVGKSKAGYSKIRFCRKQAADDGLQFFWVDTCCIDKSSSAELSEAINSMFRWYHDAAKCYVYLSDVSVGGSVGSDLSSQRTWKPAFQHSKWFTRGWTLQELLAPTSVEFFSAEGERLGNRISLLREIHDTTGISTQALQGSPLSQFSVDERMSWAKSRVTKREEDAAYCLLGIFDIHMPLIYGEGRQKALIRLKKEIKEHLSGESHALLPALSTEQLKRTHQPEERSPVVLKPELEILDALDHSELQSQISEGENSATISPGSLYYDPFTNEHPSSEPDASALEEAEADGPAAAPTEEANDVPETVPEEPAALIELEVTPVNGGRVVEPETPTHMAEKHREFFTPQPASHRIRPLLLLLLLLLLPPLTISYYYNSVVKFLPEDGFRELESKPTFRAGSPKPTDYNFTSVLIIPGTKEVDISWINKELPDQRTAIYFADDSTALLYPQNSKGHEAMLYLSWIIENYHKLPDVAIFMHARRWSWHNDDILNNDAAMMIRRLSRNRVWREGYMNMRCSWDPGCSGWMHLGEIEEDISEQEQAMLAKIWSELFPLDEVPIVFAQPCCGQFALSAERIQARPLLVYVRYRDWLLHTPLSDDISRRIWEYIFQFIFTGNNIFCPKMHTCFCSGYGVCFGGEDQYNDFINMQRQRWDREDELQEWNDKNKAIEEAKEEWRSREGQQLDAPEPGKDRVLNELIDKLRADIDEKRRRAFERGNNPENRAIGE